MSLVQPTRPSPVLVAIDIAKHRHDVLIEAPERARCGEMHITLWRPNFQARSTLTSVSLGTTTAFNSFHPVPRSAEFTDDLYPELERMCAME
jgi:hypothetical protein